MVEIEEKEALPEGNNDADDGVDSDNSDCEAGKNKVRSPNDTEVGVKRKTMAKY